MTGADSDECVTDARLMVNTRSVTKERIRNARGIHLACGVPEKGIVRAARRYSGISAKKRVVAGPRATEARIRTGERVGGIAAEHPCSVDVVAGGGIDVTSDIEGERR